VAETLSPCPSPEFPKSLFAIQPRISPRSVEGSFLFPPFRIVPVSCNSLLGYPHCFDNSFQFLHIALSFFISTPSPVTSGVPRSGANNVQSRTVCNPVHQGPDALIWNETTRFICWTLPSAMANCSYFSRAFFWVVCSGEPCVGFRWRRMTFFPPSPLFLLPRDSFSKLTSLSPPPVLVYLPEAPRVVIFHVENRVLTAFQITIIKKLFPTGWEFPPFLTATDPPLARFVFAIFDLPIACPPLPPQSGRLFPFPLLLFLTTLQYKVLFKKGGSYSNC